MKIYWPAVVVAILFFGTIAFIGVVKIMAWWQIAMNGCGA